MFNRSADKHRMRCLGFFECRHNLFREPIELLQGNLLRHADREAYRDAIEPWVFLLERLDVLDRVIRITAQEAAGLDRIRDARGSLAVGARLGSRMISICSSVIARTRRSSPNIFMFSSNTSPLPLCPARGCWPCKSGSRSIVAHRARSAFRAWHALSASRARPYASPHP